MIAKFKNKILLIISGSIAAIKIPELIKLLGKNNTNVTCVLTEAGAQFITAKELEKLSGNKVFSRLFSKSDKDGMEHIRLSRENDIILVAPASADIIAKMTHGLADDLASTILLATNKQVAIAPAMNMKMWGHPATQRNVNQLKKDGTIFIGPDSGSLACGEEGWGRMAEPAQIAKEISKLLSNLNKPEEKPLSGYKAIVTSGPTIEAIDPVRYITNRSSGKQGYAIAEALVAKGVDVTLITGPTNIETPEGVRIIKVESAKEMMEACLRTLPVDIAVCAAAVSDWSVDKISKQKIKKTGKGDNFTLTFAENPDILANLSQTRKLRPKLVIGFAAETEFIIENARVKMEQKGCDWILANDISGKKVIGKDKNKVIFISGKKEEKWPLLSKEKVAERLADKITNSLIRKKP